MLRSAASKVAWVGRTASMVFGLALVLALVVSSAALAGNLDPLKLGTAKNVATKVTAMVGKVATGSAFVVKNPSGGSALGLSVGDPLADPAAKTVAPMRVDSQAKVENLNADRIDGKEAAEIGVNGLLEVRTFSASNSDSPKSAIATCPSGMVVVGTGFHIGGGRSGSSPTQRANVVINTLDPFGPISPGPPIPPNRVFVEALEEEPVDFDWSVEAQAICATAGTP